MQPELPCWSPSLEMAPVHNEDSLAVALASMARRESDPGDADEMWEDVDEYAHLGDDGSPGGKSIIPTEAHKEGFSLGNMPLSARTVSSVRSRVVDQEALASAIEWSLGVDERPNAGADSPDYRHDQNQRQRVSRKLSWDEFMNNALSGSRSASKAVMSPSRVAKMNSRFRLHEEQKARRLAAKRRDVETQQRSGYRYAPQINSRSRQMTRHAPSFIERQESFLHRKQQHEMFAKEEIDKEATRDRALELHESVRTPCICSRGNTAHSSSCAEYPSHPRFDAGGLRSPDAAANAHSQACQRFMAMCEKMNDSYEIQRKKERMQRSIDDILAFHDEKQQRLLTRTAEARAREAQDTTFTPRINPRSQQV